MTSMGRKVVPKTYWRAREESAMHATGWYIFCRHSSFLFFFKGKLLLMFIRKIIKALACLFVVYAI